MPWKAAIWDRPQNGTRYCAQRKNPNPEWEGDDMETASDERGGVLTLGSRKAAQALADRLNSEQP